MLNIRLDYRADRQTIYVSYPTSPEDREYFLETDEDLTEHTNTLRAFWQEHCAGQRAHWVFSFDNFSMSPRMMGPEQLLSEVRKFVDAYALSVIRYGGGILPRSEARWMDGLLGGALYLCDTREDAEEALRRVRGPEFSPPVKAGHGTSLNL